MLFQYTVSTLCRKTVKRFSYKIQNADEEGLLCSTNWDKEVWDKKLHCPEKLLAIQCMASQSLYGVFEGGEYTDTYGLQETEAVCLHSGGCQLPQLLVMKGIDVAQDWPTGLKGFLTLLQKWRPAVIRMQSVLNRQGQSRYLLV